MLKLGKPLKNKRHRAMFGHREFGYRGLNRLEGACVVFSFIGAGLAGFGAFELTERLDWHFRMKTDLPGAIALIAFFVVLALMLKGVMK